MALPMMKLLMSLVVINVDVVVSSICQRSLSGWVHVVCPLQESEKKFSRNYPISYCNCVAIYGRLPSLAARFGGCKIDQHPTSSPLLQRHPASREPLFRSKSSLSLQPRTKIHQFGIHPPQFLDVHRISLVFEPFEYSPDVLHRVQ